MNSNQQSTEINKFTWADVLGFFKQMFSVSKNTNGNVLEQIAYIITQEDSSYIKNLENEQKYGVHMKRGKINFDNAKNKRINVQEQEISRLENSPKILYEEKGWEK